eukprot:358514-Chlamydomonas_euryale.AAC.15
MPTVALMQAAGIAPTETSPSPPPHCLTLVPLWLHASTLVPPWYHASTLVPPSYRALTLVPGQYHATNLVPCSTPFTKCAAQLLTPSVPLTLDHAPA